MEGPPQPQPRALRTSSVGRMFGRMRRSSTSNSSSVDADVALEETADDVRLGADSEWLKLAASRTDEGVGALEAYSSAAQALCAAVGLAEHHTSLLKGPHKGAFCDFANRLERRLGEAAGPTLRARTLVPLQARRAAQAGMEERLVARRRLRSELLHYTQKVGALRATAVSLGAKRGDSTGAAKKAAAADEKLARNEEKMAAAASDDANARAALLRDIAAQRAGLGGTVRGAEIRQLDLVHAQAMGATTAAAAEAGARAGGLTPNEERELASLEAEAGGAETAAASTGGGGGGSGRHQRTSSGRGDRPAPPTVPPPLPPGAAVDADNTAEGGAAAAAAAALSSPPDAASPNARRAARAAAAAPQSAAAAFGSPARDGQQGDPASWSWRGVAGSDAGKALYAEQENAFHRMSVGGEGDNAAMMMGTRRAEELLGSPAAGGGGGGGGGAGIADRSPLDVSQPRVRRGSVVRRISVTQGAPPPPPGRPPSASQSTPAVPNSRRRSFAAETAGLTEL